MPCQYWKRGSYLVVCSEYWMPGKSTKLKWSFLYSAHWERDKMATIYQTTFSNSFSWMKTYTFRLRFYRNLKPKVQLTIFQHLFRQWLGAVHAISHYLNQWRLVYWRIYASLGLSELRWQITKSIARGLIKMSSSWLVKFSRRLIN